MIGPHSLTEKEFDEFCDSYEGREFARTVMAAPNGDLLDDKIKPIDVVISKGEDGLRVHTFWKVQKEDLKGLENGFIEFVILADHLHPVAPGIYYG